MKTILKKQPLQLLKITIVAIVFLGLTTQCAKDEIIQPEESIAVSTKGSVSIENSGFESSFTGWTDVDPSSISSDANSGSKSAKITGSGGKVSQTVSVSANTDYELSAYVLDSWRLAVYVNGVKTSRSGTASDWEQETVSFNSGSATTVTIAAEYYAGEGRFDDFTLESGGTTTSTSAPIGSTIWLKASNGKYVCSEIRTTNAPLEADRNAAVTWEQFQVIDAGDDMIALIAYNGNYVCADKKLANVALAANRTAVGTWEKFTWVNQDDGSVALKANANGLYVTATTSVTDAPLRASASSISTAQTFTWGVMGDNSTDTDDSDDTDDTDNGSTDVPDGTASIPSDLMDNCSQWKITYPDGSEDKTLCGEDNNEYFFVSADKNAIVFRAPIRSDNGTTPNSDNVRSELRQREEDGSADIYWTTSGTHVVYSKQAITHLPIKKDELVATQIHGNKDDGIDDAMVLRLEGSHLFLSFNGGDLRDDITITTNYSLGTVHEIIFEVINGKHYCYYATDGNLESAYKSGSASAYLVKDGSNSYVMDIDYDEAYFKIGNYTQSNPEEEGSYTDDSNNYGEVYVYDFWVI
jgi:hypothetical protein